LKHQETNILTGNLLDEITLRGFKTLVALVK